MSEDSNSAEKNLAPDIQAVWDLLAARNLTAQQVLDVAAWTMAAAITALPEKSRAGTINAVEAQIGDFLREKVGNTDHFRPAP